MHLTYLRSPYSFFFLLFYVPVLLAQVEPAPGSISDYSVWYAEQDLENTLGNYRSVDLLKLKSAVKPKDVGFDKESTVFLVLKLNKQAKGRAFLKLGDLVICDDHISVSGRRIPISYSVGKPSIVSIQHRKYVTYGQISGADLQIGDTSLFSLAELVIYPRPLKREELRKVSSYLALKYSIPITHNKDDEWRDYLSHDSHLYWDKSIDFLFDEEVVALGRSDKQAFLQTQTATNATDTLILSLGDTLPLGNMPDVLVNDESYLIFSKKDEDLRNGLPCAKVKGLSNPLLNWKLHSQNWEKQAQQLFLRVAASHSFPPDSLFITDGIHLNFLPLISNNGKLWTYSLGLQYLKDDTHYLFMNKSQIDCNQQEEDLRIAFLLENGFLWANGEKLNQPLNSAQHLAIWYDAQGKPYAIDLKHSAEAQHNSNLLQQPKITVYPNPSGRSTPINVEIRELKGNEPVSLTVFNVNGKLIQKKELKYQAQIKTSLSLRMPGFYTICIRQGEAFFVLKHVVNN